MTAEPGRATLRHPTPSRPPGSNVGFHLGPEPSDVRARSQAAARRVVGERFGVVRRCREVRRPEVPGRLTAVHATGTLRIGDRPFPEAPAGVGVSPDPEAAFLSAVGETVERYCSMAPPDPASLVRSAYRHLSEPAVPPEAFALLSDDQYRRLPGAEPLTRDKTIDWLSGFSLTAGRPRLVPAALASFGVRGLPPNDYLPDAVSTGFAAHTSLPRAVLAALCEVLERDAVSIAWHARMPLSRLDADGTDVQDLVEDAAATGLRVELHQLPTDAPFPVVLAVGWSPDEPRAVTGAACRPDPVDAARKAVCEVHQMRCRLLALRPAKPERIRSVDDHAAFYASAQGSGLLRGHLRSSPEARRLVELPAVEEGTPTRALEIAVDRLADAGLEAIVTEATTPDVARAGFRVVRVLIPGTLDISGDADLPRLGGQRLHDLPVRLGLRTEPLPEAELNLLPVPLA